jgi:hypothetical protein
MYSRLADSVNRACSLHNSSQSCSVIRNKFDCYSKEHLSKRNTITRDKHDLNVKTYDSFMRAPNVHDPGRRHSLADRRAR